jgi:hypothetical protein
MNGSGTSVNRKPTNAMSPGSKYSPMRACRGECKGQRRSITQFVGESDVCIKCQRRMPKGEK